MKLEENVFYISYDDVKGKGKVHPRTGQEDPEGSRSIPLLFLYLGAIEWWVVNATPRPLYSRERDSVPIV
jgi:hypothetical protein